MTNPLIDRLKTLMQALEEMGPFSPDVLPDLETAFKEAIRSCIDLGEQRDTLVAEVKALKALLQEALEMDDIAIYRAPDLCDRIKAALSA